MRKLYEINEEIERLLDTAYTVKIDDETAVDTETGEMINLAERLEALQIERGQKIKSVAFYLDDLKMKLDAVGEKKAAIAQKEKQLKREIEGLENYLLFATDNKGYADDDIEVKVKETRRVDIIDETLIPEQYLKIKTETTISKTDIDKAIKNGETVQGAEIKTYYSIKII